MEQKRHAGGNEAAKGRVGLAIRDAAVPDAKKKAKRSIEKLKQRVTAPPNKSAKPDVTETNTSSLASAAAVDTVALQVLVASPFPQRHCSWHEAIKPIFGGTIDG